MRRTINLIALSVLGAALMLGSLAITAVTADAADGRTVTLYADQKTGQVFYKPCRRCVRLGTYVPAGATEEIERKVEMKTQAQLDADRAAMQADLATRQAQQQQWNAEMAKQVSEIQPFAREFGDRWFKKISIGTLVYGYYGYWSHTGFGPQFMDANMNWPGPGNNSFNQFAINRTYIDIKFTPIDDISMRITPDMYTTIGTATADSVGKSTGFNTTLDGNLGIRLKYAYLDYNTFFKKILQVGAMSEDKFTFGQQQNPLVDWEENLWGFRYTALTPWNYLSLSSAQVGLSMKGPIKFHELQYADYDFGVYDDSNFHTQERSAYKQVMGRITVNPFGAKSRYDNLGITGFYDYGYSNNCTPDLNASPTPGTINTTCAHMARAAALLHYTAESWGIVGEWDYGHNAFNSGNLFSGSGPIDDFNRAVTTPFRQFDNMVRGLQNNNQTVQMGWDALGHVDIPHTPFTVFGLFQWFLPNTRVMENPLDFQRYDIGVQWTINKYFRVAADSQAIMYYHDQFTLPAGTLFRKAKEVPFAVPRDTHAFFLHMEFRY
jgi:hypothetical protein